MSDHTVDTRLCMLSDEEAQRGIQALFAHDAFLRGLKALLPAELQTAILNKAPAIKNTHDFQAELIRPFLQFIKDKSISTLSATGLDTLDPTRKYLFISNHRDIALDSAFLNWLLFEHGFSTSQIAIGDNLMKHKLAELIFRINKSFAVLRAGSPREIYAHSVQLSAYVHQTITSNTDSVWIAQREGRAKDGNDSTQVALLKMLGMAANDSLATHFKDLCIVPVSIAYEYDPNDAAKTQEYVNKLADPDYKKTFDADLQHILTGITGWKGQVHLHFGTPLQQELDVLNSTDKKQEQLDLLAQLLDQHIQQNYHLCPINFIAHDLLYHTDMHKQHYQHEELQAVTTYFHQRLQHFSTDAQAAARHYLLGMYANPLINKTKWGGDF